MDVQLYRLRLQPLSDFGTPLVGDTLFGHLCWALRWRHGAERLATWLQGYTEGQPFAVLSDAFPGDWLPRPTIGAHRLGRMIDSVQRKADKQRHWLPLSEAAKPLAEWIDATTAQPAQGTGALGVVTQNTIHRLTGTTGTGMFAPRQVERLSFAPGQVLDVYAAIDAQRLEPAALLQALDDIGQAGYGRDATTGLGKFRVIGHETWHWSSHKGAAHGLTLAPCAPEPTTLDAQDCHYLPMTRFGRHGSTLAVAGQPFKKPILLLRTGAVLAFPREVVPVVHGRGLGGPGQPLSDVEPATVHQGYCPVMPVRLPALAAPKRGVA